MRDLFSRLRPLGFGDMEAGVSFNVKGASRKCKEAGLIKNPEMNFLPAGM